MAYALPLFRSCQRGATDAHLTAANTSREQPLIFTPADEVRPLAGNGGGMGYAEGDGSRQPISASTDRLTVPVTIFLSEAEIHVRVESAVEALLEDADLLIEDREEPLTGSSFPKAGDFMHPQTSLGTSAMQYLVLASLHAARYSC
jgi:hypothetical protein